jgi:uncharacterized protein (DUF1800 family)
MALPSTPDPVRTALNRLTFGASDSDVALAKSKGGIAGWLADQFAVPAGDDPDLATFIASQTMPISYAAAPAGSGGTWKAVNELRPLNYLNASLQTLWNVSIGAGTTYAYAERVRIMNELLAATWIRNIHSQYQLREFMVDFWINHFNIGKTANQFAADLLPVYDRVTIRPNVFGNFRTLLEATASAPSMLFYLDNEASTAAHPNENYAREIMELHTLGGANYLGAAPTSVPVGTDGVALGFDDQDVIQASRALSGWTVQEGQRLSKTSIMPNTGLFTYQPAFHNTQATKILNVDISGLTAAQAQGRKLLDLIAYHPATATFVVTKLCKRIFGDNPPAAVISRGVAAWNANTKASNQIQKVLDAIVTGGSEISTFPISKLRRPYERLVAFARTTDMTVNASASMSTVFDPAGDGPYIWLTPDGRPDNDGHWLGTGANLTAWNQIILFPTWPTVTSGLEGQMPTSYRSSPTLVVQYWVERMVGYTLSANSMTALINDQSGPAGVPAWRLSSSATSREQSYRRLVSLIATTEEFSYR